MKTINYLFLLTAILISGVCCSTAANSTQVSVNVNAADSNAPAPTPTLETTAAAGEAKKTAPDALVKDLYEQHNKKNSPFFQTKNRALVDKYFDKNLADSIWKDAKSANGEVGALDGDPLYDAQDTNIKKFAVGAAKITGERAEVPVGFINFEEKRSFTFILVQRNGEWKISDINYGDGSTLTGIFKENSQNNETRGGEFEGTYQVGDTTCTVKPIKMAFEVKWAKGTGTEIFFADEGAENSFVSESNGDEKENVFSFVDETYNVGTFIRADGKRFPVKRIK